MRWSAIRCSISSPCWWTSRWWSPTTAGAEPATGCWKRCANTPWKSSANPARPTPCGRVTATTTRRWPPLLDAPAGSDYEQRLEQADIEIDNLRAAFAWSRENSDIELALALASSLQPLWLARGRIREGLAWFDTALADLDAQHPGVAAAVRARALADKAVLDTWAGAAASLDQAQQALAIARDVDDPALLARTLTACGFIAGAGLSTPRWPGHASPRRSAWPVPWTIGGG